MDSFLREILSEANIFPTEINDIIISYNRQYYPIYVCDLIDYMCLHEDGISGWWDNKCRHINPKSKPKDFGIKFKKHRDGKWKRYKR